MLDGFFIGSDVFVLNFQPLFSSLLITQEFNQDLKKVGHCVKPLKWPRLEVLEFVGEAPLNFSSSLLFSMTFM